MVRLLVPSIVLVLVSGATVRAEPIAITVGFVQFTDEPATFMLSGRGFSVAGDWFGVAVRGTPWFEMCQPSLCRPGEVIDYRPTTYEYRFSEDDSSQSISGVIAGTFYNELFLDGELTFTGPRVIAPSDLDDLSPRRFGAFTMEGHLTAYQDRARTRGAVFSTDVVGAGTARVVLDVAGPGFKAADVDYHFAEAAPVPEPGTLLLFGTGAAMFGRRLIRDRRNPG